MTERRALTKRRPTTPVAPQTGLLHAAPCVKPGGAELRFTGPAGKSLGAGVAWCPACEVVGYVAAFDD